MQRTDLYESVQARAQNQNDLLTIFSVKDTSAPSMNQNQLGSTALP